MPGLVSAGWRGGDRKRWLPWLAGLSLHVAFPVTVPLPGGWKVAQADLWLVSLCRRLLRAAPVQRYWRLGRGRHKRLPAPF